MLDGAVELDDGGGPVGVLDEGGVLGGVLWCLPDVLDVLVLVGILDAPASYFGYPNAPERPATSTPTTPTVMTPIKAARLFRMLQRPFPHGHGVVPPASRLHPDPADGIFDKFP